MSRAFVKEEDSSPPPRFGLPARDDPGYLRAAARALLKGADQGDSASAEEATGLGWGDPRLVPAMGHLLEEARADQDDRGEQLAERFLHAAAGLLPPRPTLLTFDIFGTVLDWRTGLLDASAAAGRPLAPEQFDAVIDAQAALEAGPFRRYRDITIESLVSVAGVARSAAESIGATVGEWPLYPDSRDALAKIHALAPAAAMTNSDRDHGVQVRQQLGFDLAYWFCAEDVGVYKPASAFWDRVAARIGRPFGPDWWHVSAYADYDGKTAAQAGLTTVLVRRPHHRAGPADLVVDSLTDLVPLVRLAVDRTA